MPASPPRKFSPTPATRATAARGKSGQPARPSCGNIIPPARGKPRPWRLISPRWAVTRGRSNSGGRQPWARARRPRRGATKATAVGRRSRANPRQVRPRRARSGLAVPPRAWKRAICRSLPRREAGPRLLRRKLSWRHRHGRTQSKTSRNSAETAVAAELRPVPPACFQTSGNRETCLRDRAQTRLSPRDRLAFSPCAAESASTKNAIFSPLRHLPAPSRLRPHACGAPRSPLARRRPPPPPRPPQRLPHLPRGQR